jgi:hypothetical protein
MQACFDCAATLGISAGRSAGRSAGKVWVEVRAGSVALRKLFQDRVRWMVAMSAVLDADCNTFCSVPKNPRNTSCFGTV